MANRGQSQYLRILDDSTTYVRWQNYYVNQTVSLSSASWSYFPFVVNGLAAGSTESEGDLTVDIPATATAVSIFEAALANGRLCEIKMYEFDSRLSQAAPQASQVLIASVLGEIVSVGGSFVSLTVRLGSSLAPVGAQVPPRKYNTILVGAPLRL
jgi:hypothetical protein